MSISPTGKPAGLSIFFPAYNDNGTIASMVIRAVKAAEELTPDFEIIVVDDGSADGTAEIADELARCPEVRAVHHPSIGTTAQLCRLANGHQGLIFYGRRRAVRPGRAFRAVERHDAGR
jgi:cellulose synthase/poly-beta-1,6-N-acetylglucosamine synthase-like glycosyltransferase